MTAPPACSMAHDDHTIEVFRHAEGYFARFHDRCVLRFLETDTLPLPYTHQADPLDVLHHVTADNPFACVLLVPATPQTVRTASTATGFRNAPSMS